MMKPWPLATSGATNFCCCTSSTNAFSHTWQRTFLIESIWIFPFRIPMQGLAIIFMEGLIHENQVVLTVIAASEYWLFMMHVKALRDLAFRQPVYSRLAIFLNRFGIFCHFFQIPFLSAAFFSEVCTYFFDLTFRSLVIAGFKTPRVNPHKWVRCVLIEIDSP
jgi:hypothetical protein